MSQQRREDLKKTAGRQAGFSKGSGTQARNAGHEDHPQNLSAVAILHAWRRALQADYAQAKASVDDLCRRMSEFPSIHWSDINRYRAQMLNGVACPSDFILADHGLITRA